MEEQNDLLWQETKEANGLANIIVFRGAKSHLAAWVLQDEGKWIARTTTGVRGEFEDEESARSFLKLVLSTGTNG